MRGVLFMFHHICDNFSDGGNRNACIYWWTGKY